MVAGWVVLCEVISQVQVAWCPVHLELFLVHPVLDPVESHVHCFGPTLFARAVSNSHGSGVVDLDGYGALWPAQFMEGGVQDGGFFGVGEKGGQFSFGGRGHDGLDDAGDVEDSTIVQDRGIVLVVAEEKMTSGATLGEWFREA